MELHRYSINLQPVRVDNISIDRIADKYDRARVQWLGKLRNNKAYGLVCRELLCRGAGGRHDIMGFVDRIDKGKRICWRKHKKLRREILRIISTDRLRCTKDVGYYHIHPKTGQKLQGVNIFGHMTYEARKKNNMLEYV